MKLLNLIFYKVSEMEVIKGKQKISELKEIENEIDSVSTSCQTEDKFSNHSPRKEALRAKLRKKNKEISRLKKKLAKFTAIQKEEKLAPTTSNLKDYLKATEHLFKKFPDISTFVKTQATVAAKRPRGRRYSLAMKRIALKMFFSSAKCYRASAQSFCLPHPRTLEHKIEDLEFPPGLHPIVLDYFKIAINSFNDLDKICILCVDEASIKANLFYSVKHDEIIGLEDLGDGKKHLNLHVTCVL